MVVNVLVYIDCYCYCYAPALTTLLLLSIFRFHRLLNYYDLLKDVDDVMVTRKKEFAGNGAPSYISKRVSKNIKVATSVLPSTEEIYRSPFPVSNGPYAHIRSKLDYTYHSYYTVHRQHLQDSITQKLLRATKVTCPVPPTTHWIVFTAGAMGAGKTHTVRSLADKGNFPLDSFVGVDPDEIRWHLPEFKQYVEFAPHVAGELSRKEAGYIAEMLTLAALDQKKNVLVDGTLRDCEWYKQHFEVLRKQYPSLKIGIIHVTAPRQTVIERASMRSLETGRVVPIKTLEETLEQVPKSVRVLGPLSDFFCEVSNPPESEIQIVTEGCSWESFGESFEDSTSNEYCGIK